MALFLIGTTHDPSIAPLLKARGDSFALCLESPSGTEDPNYDMIGINNLALGEAAAQHLIDLGHKEIACIFGASEGNDRTTSRRRGILDQMAKHGIIPPREWLCQSQYDLRMARTIAVDLLSQEKRPSAIIYGNDVIAFCRYLGCPANRAEKFLTMFL